MVKTLGLHGFLGSPRDFDFFPTVQGVDLDFLVEKEYGEIADFVLEEPVNIIGYSFGARLAARLKCDFPDRVHKLILCSGHMGLKEKSEKEQRVLFEKQMSERLQSMSQKEFLLFWNDLSLFVKDKPLQIDSVKEQSWDRQQLYFSNYGLSKQPYLLEELKNYKNDILFVYGEQDEKYCLYARENLVSDFEVEFIEAGHRVLQNQKSMLKVMEHFL